MLNPYLRELILRLRVSKGSLAIDHSRIIAKIHCSLTRISFLSRQVSLLILNSPAISRFFKLFCIIANFAKMQLLLFLGCY